jgi:Na+/H+ antiporter NhaD/arsenite permease-like protein
MPHLAAFSGQATIALLCIAYALVFLEELLSLRKSASVMVAGGLIWILVAIQYHSTGHSADVSIRLRSVLLEYAELFLFLLCATSFVNAMVERNLFEALRSHATRLQLSQRAVFWLTGGIAFVLSPVADNLTTALVAGTVSIAALGKSRKAAVVSLVSIVVAANAGGAFSPFDDINTLMVWQKGVVHSSSSSNSLFLLS